jgi:ribosomal-protein-alanine N-acetyltransferase
LSPTPTLRPFRTTDFDRLYEIDQACYPSGIAYSKRTLRWFLHQPASMCYVATAGEEIIGFVIVEWDASHGHIITLDVVENQRRSGVGSLLLREVESSLALRGVRRIELETATDNEPAIAFWEKHGYRTRGILKNYYLDRIDALWMQKVMA